jgi:hypothetical protein
MNLANNYCSSCGLDYNKCKEGYNNKGTRCCGGCTHGNIVKSLDKTHDVTIEAAGEATLQGSFIIVQQGSEEGSDRVTVVLTNGTAYHIETKTLSEVMFAVRARKDSNASPDELLKIGFTKSKATPNELSQVVILKKQVEESE